MILFVVKANVPTLTAPVPLGVKFKSPFAFVTEILDSSILTAQVNGPTYTSGVFK